GITGGAGVVGFADAVTAARAAGLTPNSVDHGFRNPQLHSWNVNFQREITASLGLMIGYFGSRGENLRISRNINQPVDGVRPYRTLAATSPVLPGAALGNIVEIDSQGVSNYHALWVSAQQRARKGLQFGAAYTFSRS